MDDFTKSAGEPFFNLPGDRVKGDRGKRLGRLRSEYVERSFAHVCRTGGARRSWLRGLEDVTKRYLMYVAGRNLGVIMRSLFGVGKPKTLQAAGRGVLWLIMAVLIAVSRALGWFSKFWVHRIQLPNFWLQKMKWPTPA